MIATHAGQGEELIKQPRGDGWETVTITYDKAEELTGLAEEHGLAPVELQERPPLDNEHQVRKLYPTASATERRVADVVRGVRRVLALLARPAGSERVRRGPVV